MPLTKVRMFSVLDDELDRDIAATLERELVHSGQTYSEDSAPTLRPVFRTALLSGRSRRPVAREMIYRNDDAVLPDGTRRVYTYSYRTTPIQTGLTTRAQVCPPVCAATLAECRGAGHPVVTEVSCAALTREYRARGLTTPVP